MSFLQSLELVEKVTEVRSRVYGSKKVETYMVCGLGVSPSHAQRHNYLVYDRRSFPALITIVFLPQQ